MFSFSEWFADRIFGTKEEIAEHFREDSLEDHLKPVPLWIPEDTPQSRESAKWIHNKFEGPEAKARAEWIHNLKYQNEKELL